MMTTVPALFAAEIDWQRMHDRPYMFAAVVDGTEVLLRLNDFPDEPLCTIFFEGQEHNLEALGDRWTLPE